MHPGACHHHVKDPEDSAVLDSLLLGQFGAMLDRRFHVASTSISVLSQPPSSRHSFGLKTDLPRHQDGGAWLGEPMSHVVICVQYLSAPWSDRGEVFFSTPVPIDDRTAGTWDSRIVVDKTKETNILQLHHDWILYPWYS